MKMGMFEKRAADEGSRGSLAGAETGGTVAKLTKGWDAIEDAHMVAITDSDHAAGLFRRSVNMVEVEVFSYCNRRCWFCPNSKIDRISANRYMDTRLYSSIMDQLASIGYAGKISYSRYNEPLADRCILDRIREAREKLPAALLHTNSNGDYLTPDYLAELYDAGLRSLRIQVYLQNEERYSDERIRERAAQTLDRLGIPARKKIDVKGKRLEYRLSYRDMDLRLYGRNFETDGTSRGGLVDVKRDYRRTSPCLVPFLSVYIDYNGKMMPCCNFRSDAPEHADYIMADLNVERNLFLAYANSRLASFRRSLLNEDEKGGLCGDCHFSLKKVLPEHRSRMKEMAG